MDTNWLDQAVIDEAIAWLGTPFHDHGHVKSVGVDCLGFIVCCYQAAAVFGDVASAAPPYVAQWAMHRSEED